MATTRGKRRNDGCPRCGEYRLFGGSVQLVGGYNAALCDECRNDWDVFIRKHPEYLEFCDIQARGEMLLVRTQGDGIDRLDEVRAVQAEGRAQMRTLFDIAVRWVADTIERPEDAE